MTGLFTMPVAVFEFSLGIYLVVKGFKQTAALEDNPDEIIQFGCD